jgi:hypothetical protein
LERVDGMRRSFASDPLPEGRLRVAWNRAVAPADAHSPLVTPDGEILALTVHGDLLELGSDGTEKRRLGVGLGPLSPGAILADGTLVTMTASGEAVGVRLTTQNARVRFRTRVGDQGVQPMVAPLALDDGGVIVAHSVARRAVRRGAVTLESELAVLDAEGVVRVKAIVPTWIAWPLLAAGGGVAAIGAEGAVFLWAPGDATRSLSGGLVRVGSFDGRLDGGAAARGASELVAVVDGRRVVSLDLAHGQATVLATTSTSTWLGPPSIGGDAIYLLEATTTGTLLVTIDRAGSIRRDRLSTLPAGIEIDGGVSPSSTPVHTATLVDGAGRVAFGGPDGHVGVFHSGTVDDLGGVVCERGVPPVDLSVSATSASPHALPSSRPSAGFAGLSPAGPGTFLVACEGGALLEVTEDR